METPQTRFAGKLVSLYVKGLTGFPVLDDLKGIEMTQAAHITYARVFFAQIEQLFLEVAGNLLGQAGIKQLVVLFHSRFDR